MRDVHNRCVVCGRPPGEACCEECHTVAETFEKQYRQAMRDRGLATYEKNFGINTEAANQ